MIRFCKICKHIAGTKYIKINQYTKALTCKHCGAVLKIVRPDMNLSLKINNKENQ